MPTVAAIVPATNRPPVLERCESAIRATTDPPDELIVVDGPPGVGPAGARNAGAMQASSDVLVFVDADVEVHPDAFTRIRAAFADQDLTAMFGSYDDSPEAPGTVSTFRNLLHHHVHQSSPGAAATFWAGLGAVRREAFVEAGGFDDQRFPHPSIEDIELGMRLTRAGGVIRLDPYVLGKHLKDWGFGEMIRTDFARRGVPWIGLLLEERGRVSARELNLGWPHRLSAATCVIGLGGALLRRPAVVIASIGLLVAFNRSFYAMLGRRDPRLAVAGVGLHAVHHLTSAAAVPAGFALHVLDGRQAPGPGVAR
jgi:glycosyltransferase involved in cell wall biosynthesis